jgi:hypothetical protein
MKEEMPRNCEYAKWQFLFFPSCNDLLGLNLEGDILCPSMLFQNKNYLGSGALRNA